MPDGHSIHKKIQTLLNEGLGPVHLEVIDESHMHSRRSIENPETHFKVVVVSSVMKGLSRVQQQRKVYDLLKPLFAQGLHGLNQTTFTPEEWANSPTVANSPRCASSKKVE